MAVMAKLDQESRTIEVDRQELIKTLESNREKHIQDYDAAMAGYKDLLLSNIDSAFENAKVAIAEKYEETKQKVTNFTDEDIAKQPDYFTLVDDITINMKVPRSFAKEYDAAIDMAKWDVRKTLELTHAEFTCFVRDQWDWKSGFEAVSTRYIGKKSPF